MNKPALLSRFWAVISIVAFSLPEGQLAFPRPAFAAGLSDSSAPAASTYFVNSTQDTPDSDPSDGLCAGAHGRCALRAAIMQANFLTGGNTIILPAGVFTLTRVGTMTMPWSAIWIS